MPRKDYLQTSVSLTEDDQARLERLRKLLKLPMNKVFCMGLQLLEQLVEAQRLGRRVKINEEVIMFLIPLENLTPVDPKKP